MFLSCLESSCWSAFLVSFSSSWRVVVISSSFFQDGTHIHLGSEYIIVSAVLVIPSSQWACAVLVVVIAPGEAPLAAPVVRHLWQAPTSAFACIVVVVVDPPPPDAHEKDEGPSPLERKPPPPKSALSTESVESTTRRSLDTLMRLAQTGAITKAARRTA